MNRHLSSMLPEYFEDMFQQSRDPWDLETSPYEQRKREHSLRVLAGRKYDRAFEVGCAGGMLTAGISGMVGALLAIDVSGTALRAARRRCADIGNVDFANMRFPRQAPASDFDLIVLSEVVYYWDDEDIVSAGEWIRHHLSSVGTVLLVHWTGKTDYPQSGDQAVEKLHDAMAGAVQVASSEHCAEYRLDLWRNVE